MAGRLRKQLKDLEAIRVAADALYSLIYGAAPKGLITSESMLERIGGELADEKAELWHKMLGGAFDCSDSAMQLEDMLEERIRNLPTYRPPPVLELGAGSPEQTAEVPPQIDSGNAIPDAPAEG